MSGSIDGLCIVVNYFDILYLEIENFTVRKIMSSISVSVMPTEYYIALRDYLNYL